jgi:hypothetical protein
MSGLIAERDRLAREALKMAEETRRQERRLRELASRNNALVAENRALYRQLDAPATQEQQRQPAPEKKTARIRALQRSTAELDTHNAMLRGVLEGLVSESALNWANDPDLRALILDDHPEPEPDTPKSAAVH